MRDAKISGHSDLLGQGRQSAAHTHVMWPVLEISFEQPVEAVNQVGDGEVQYGVEEYPTMCTSSGAGGIQT